MTDTRRLIDQLAARAEPVRPLSSPLRRTALWVVLAAVLIAMIASVYGLRTGLLADLAQAPLLLSLNTSMLYFGTALGAALGGAASAAIGFNRLSWIGVPLAVLGLGTLAFGRSRAPHAVLRHP